MASRVNKNLRWVKRQIDRAGQTDVIEEEILDAMSYAELEIMERTGSVRQQDVITFDLTGPHATGLYTFPSGVDRLVYIQCPATWTRPTILTEDAQTLDQIQKANISGTQPLVAYVSNSTIQFWPVPTSGETVTLFSFRTPTDPAEQQTEGGDPILSRHWDYALRYMALATLIGGEWVARAGAEYEREAHHHLRETGMPIQVDHSSNRLGF
jgi:hypothetical protein